MGVSIRSLVRTGLHRNTQLQAQRPRDPHDCRDAVLPFSDGAL